MAFHFNIQIKQKFDETSHSRLTFIRIVNSVIKKKDTDRIFYACPVHCVFDYAYIHSRFHETYKYINDMPFPYSVSYRPLSTQLYKFNENISIGAPVDRFMFYNLSQATLRMPGCGNNYFRQFFRRMLFCENCVIFNNENHTNERQQTFGASNHLFHFV